VRQLHLSRRNCWLAIMLVFGIGPLAIYLVFISPSIDLISTNLNQINLKTAGASIIDHGPAAATKQEVAQLEKIKQVQLSRIKRIKSRESLLRFTGALADAIALQARSLGMRVIEVNLQSGLINGRYVPASDRAMETLAGLPNPQWDELADPLDLPMLHLPSIKMQITVTAKYSQVFSFIESLPDFPTLVNLAGLETIDDPAGRAYRLTIRGYYCGNENSKPQAQVENANHL
jgi:hypothetical protein